MPAIESSDVLFVLVVAALFLWLRLRRRRRPGRRRSRRADGRAFQPGDTIAGKAFVIDGDTIRVAGITVRLAGLDAPELDQVAQDRHGAWHAHGVRVRDALIRAIGGRAVQVRVTHGDRYGRDKYGRVVGIVLVDGKDVGEWLVRNGHAIAAYGDRYRDVEREARRARRGMWGHAEAYDPRDWRHR